MLAEVGIQVQHVFAPDAYAHADNKIHSAKHGIGPAYASRATYIHFVIVFLQFRCFVTLYLQVTRLAQPSVVLGQHMPARPLVMVYVSVIWHTREISRKS